jgi:hypothetical protein
MLANHGPERPSLFGHLLPNRRVIPNEAPTYTGHWHQHQHRQRACGLIHVAGNDVFVVPVPIAVLR